MQKRQILKYLRWPLFVALLILAACSKDELDSPLVGKWEGISFIASAPVDENMDGIAHTDLTEEMECAMMNASFSGGGSFTITSAEDTYDIDIVDGEVVLTHTGCSDVQEKGSWITNEINTLLYLEFKVPGNPESTLVEVEIELTDDQLIMKNLFYSENDEEIITYTVVFARK